MAQLKKVLPKRDRQREMEVLTSQVRLDGKGEDPAVQALMSDEFAKMSDLDAMQVALSLQQIIKGQASLLENQNLMAEHIVKLNEKMAKYDEDQKKYDEDRVKFMNEVLSKAEKNRIVSDTGRARLEGDIKEQYQNAVRKAAERLAAEKAAMKLKMASDPKETIVSPGVPEIRSVNGTPTLTIVPEVMSFMSEKFIFPPNVPVQVPRFVADEYRNKKQREAEKQERLSAVHVGKDFDTKNNQAAVAQRILDIDRKYGVSSEPMPLASE